MRLLDMIYATPPPLPIGLTEPERSKIDRTIRYVGAWSVVDYLETRHIVILPTTWMEQLDGWLRATGRMFTGPIEEMDRLLAPT